MGLSCCKPKKDDLFKSTIMHTEKKSKGNNKYSSETKFTTQKTINKEDQSNNNGNNNSSKKSYSNINVSDSINIIYIEEGIIDSGIKDNNHFMN